MGLFKSAMAVAAINLRRWLKDIRVQVIFIFVGYIIIEDVWTLTSYGIENGKTLTFCLLPILFQRAAFGSTKMLLHIGMLFLLCDAPFFSPISPYMILRSRRNAWWIGECIYIVCASLIYLLFIMIVSSLATVPVITLENDWGDIPYEIAFAEQNLPTDDWLAFMGQFKLHMLLDMIRYLVPFGTQAYTFAAAWLSFSFIGLVMYAVSLAKRSMLPGMIVASVFIFIDPFLAWIGESPHLAWTEALSPVTWVSISEMKEMNRLNIMSVPVALGAFVGLITLLCILIARCSKKAMIELIR